MKRFASLALGVLAAVTLATAARADLRTTYATGPTVFGGAGTSSVRGVAVNSNPESPYYGYVYVTDPGFGAGNIFRRVMIFRPDPVESGTGATAYVDTGWTVSIPGADQLSPFDVFVDANDTIWMADYGGRRIYTSPHPDAANPTLNTPVAQVTMADFDADAKADMVANGAPDTVAVGNPRGLWVLGTAENATVLVANYAGSGANSTVQQYTVTGGTASTAGTDAHVWSRHQNFGAGPYGVTADAAGNVYVPVGPTTAEGNTIRKYSAAGVLDEGFTAPLPIGVTGSVVPDVSFVADSSAAGGGYLVHSGRFGTSSGGNVVLRYSLSGEFLDGYGPAAAGAPSSYQTLALAGSTPSYMAVDDLGNIYQRTVIGSNSGVVKIFRKAPFVAAAGAATSATAPVKSSPTAVDGVVYFGANDGKLYAYTTADGNPVAGFPVDISTAVGATVQLLGRPSVYLGTSSLNIYLTTNRGDVVKVNLQGQVVWSYTSHAGAATNTATAPAVTPNGDVVAAINGPNGVQVIKLNDTDGQFLGASPVLAPATGSISSPAVEGNKVYVGAQGSTTGDLLVLNLADLSVLASFAGSEGVVAPPHVKGIDAYVGTLAGNLYKINSATLTPDAGFGGLAGTPGRAAIGEPLVTDAFPNTSSTLPGGVFYVGSTMGKVWGVNAVDGAFTLFYNTGNATAVVGGLVINRDEDILAFGTSAGTFYEVPLLAPSAAQVFPGYGALTTTPTVDRATGRFLVGSDDSNVYAFP